MNMFIEDVIVKKITIENEPDVQYILPSGFEDQLIVVTEDPVSLHSELLDKSKVEERITEATEKSRYQGADALAQQIIAQLGYDGVKRFTLSHDWSKGGYTTVDVTYDTNGQTRHNKFIILSKAEVGPYQDVRMFGANVNLVNEIIATLQVNLDLGRLSTANPKEFAEMMQRWSERNGRSKIHVQYPNSGESQVEKDVHDVGDENDQGPTS